MDREYLRKELLRIDGRGYPAYKDIRGHYDYSTFTAYIDKVQGDPFAAPSRMRVRVPQAVAGYPRHTYQNLSRRIGLENYLLHTFCLALDKAQKRRGSGKSGLMQADHPGQEMLARTALSVNREFVEAQFMVGLPAQGRRVSGRIAARMLCEDLPRIVEETLTYRNNDASLIQRYCDVNEDADFLREALEEKGLVAFVARESVLPRTSGIDERPLRGEKVIKWLSPEELEVSFDLPNAGCVSGTGIAKGVTLVVGGGFHGKSTLLEALKRGVYNHRPGDGRELVITTPRAVEIRAEDGRRVSGVNISPFINGLPFGQDTTAFSTENASGSTSQAANIMESLEMGASLLLIDEDTAATNFMIRDRRMQALVSKECEPITPFIDRVEEIYKRHGVSTILVMGGSGDYFDVACKVMGMNTYRPRDLTREARRVAAEFQTERKHEVLEAFNPLMSRVPIPESIHARKGKKEVSVKIRDRNHILFGTETINLSAIGQLIDSGQTRAIGDALWYAKNHYIDGKTLIGEVLDKVMKDIEREGLAVLARRPGPDYAIFRKFELGAALNRLRSLLVRHARNAFAG